MNKTVLSFFFAWIFALASWFSTNIDTQIFEQLESWPTADDLNFQTFQSCEDMGTVLQDYIKDNFENQWNWWIRYNGGFGWGIPMPMMAFEDESAVMDIRESLTTTSSTVGTSAGDSAWNALQKTWWPWITNSSTNDFSNTNTQVVGVDEADILKTDGDYIYYYNQKEQEVNIIKSPLDIASSTINLERLEVVTNIKLPNTFNGIQMYLHDDTLTIISNRWRQNWKWGFLNNWNQTDVIVYDVSNPAKPGLIKFTEIDGAYSDSRRIWDKLYLVNQIRLDRYWPMQQWKEIDDIDFADIEIAPKSIDIAYTQDDSKKNFAVGDDVFPYHISVNEADCNNIYYVLPSKDSVEQFGLHPSFSTVNVIDLSDTSKKPDITTAFGSTNTIHMAPDNLYLTQHFYIPWESWACPPNARCIMPNFSWWEHTLIHKFNVIDQWVMYQDSTLVNWSPLTQYSMDQWPTGNFRILTSTRSPERATHLSILNKDLDVVGSLQDIEPWEEFKSSRYIWDKLYLVTFEQTDPLFVIDMVDDSNPTIIWELIIPWFSTYLHPYGPVVNNVQYLLWLGRETDLNEWWWTNQEWIKVDLYKIDYNQKTSDNHVSVTQEYSKVRWEQWSESEAIYNPRMFVWDDSRKVLVLPMHLREQEEGTERCESERDPEGNIIWEECRTDGNQITTFIGMKAINITPENWIIETASFDYSHLYKQDPEIYNNGRYNTWMLMPRVGYLGDVLFQVNGAFGHFINTNNNTQSFLPLWDTSINFSPNSLSGSNRWGTEPISQITPMNVTKCLDNAGRTLFTVADCRYCEPQKEVFEDYYEKLDVVDCTEFQEECSGAWITWYPTWTNSDGTESYPWLQDLESLADLAWC